jgi:hypothetical protein
MMLLDNTRTPHAGQAVSARVLEEGVQARGLSHTPATTGKLTTALGMLFPPTREHEEPQIKLLL